MTCNIECHRHRRGQVCLVYVNGSSPWLNQLTKRKRSNSPMPKQRERERNREREIKWKSSAICYRLKCTKAVRKPPEMKFTDSFFLSFFSAGFCPFFLSFLDMNIYLDIHIFEMNLKLIKKKTSEPFSEGNLHQSHSNGIRAKLQLIPDASIFFSF